VCTPTASPLATLVELAVAVQRQRAGGDDDAALEDLLNFGVKHDEPRRRNQNDETRITNE
jgi:hypothetical protein